MAGGHKPRSGSLAFYPRKRARRETPSFRTFPSGEGESSKPLNFFGYKAGMLHLMAKNAQPKSVTHNQDVAVAGTVIECPPLKVFGVRAYRKTHYGNEAAFEVHSEKLDPFLRKRISQFHQPQQKEKKPGKSPKTAQEGGRKTIEDLEKEKDSIVEVRLLAHSQPGMTGIGKHKPEVFELALSGNLEQQILAAKAKLGESISVGEMMEEKQFLDVRAVNTGKGFQGAVKRFGVKMQRPKAKKRRIVGSIGPWNPSTVMWTVPRPGQMGYHTRTEYNKRVLKISNVPDEINPPAGFTRYGNVKNEYVILAGSVPGPVKRLIGMRMPIRNAPGSKHNFSDISHFSTREGKKSAPPRTEEGSVQKEKGEKEAHPPVQEASKETSKKPREKVLPNTRTVQKEAPKDKTDQQRVEKKDAKHKGAGKK